MQTSNAAGNGSGAPRRVRATSRRTCRHFRRRAAAWRARRPASRRSRRRRPGARTGACRADLGQQCPGAAAEVEQRGIVAARAPRRVGFAIEERAPARAAATRANGVIPSPRLPLVVDRRDRVVQISRRETGPRIAFLSDCACLSRSIRCFARRDRRRFWRRTRSASCWRLLAAPRRRSSIFSASMRRAMQSVRALRALALALDRDPGRAGAPARRRSRPCSRSGRPCRPSGRTISSRSSARTPRRARRSSSSRALSPNSGMARKLSRGLTGGGSRAGRPAPAATLARVSPRRAAVHLVVFIYASGCWRRLRARAGAALRPKARRTCLVLSVGGPAGVAHIGAIAAIKEAHIRSTASSATAWARWSAACTRPRPATIWTRASSAFVGAYADATRQEALRNGLGLGLIAGGWPRRRRSAARRDPRSRSRAARRWACWRPRSWSTNAWCACSTTSCTARRIDGGLPVRFVTFYQEATNTGVVARARRPRPAGRGGRRQRRQPADLLDAGDRAGAADRSGRRSRLGDAGAGRVRDVPGREPAGDQRERPADLHRRHA